MSVSYCVGAIKGMACLLCSGDSRWGIHPVDLAQGLLEGLNDVCMRLVETIPEHWETTQHIPVMTFVPFSLESPPKTSFAKYLPAANPSVSST